jgi:hypothetical protein
MGHIHNYKTCRDGVCGDTIVTCKQCRLDLHCYTIPADWLGCCALHSSKCPHKDLFVIFCSAHCRRVYMEVYDRQMNVEKDMELDEVVVVK